MASMRHGCCGVAAAALDTIAVSSVGFMTMRCARHWWCSGKRPAGCAASGCGSSFPFCSRRWNAMVICSWLATCAAGLLSMSTATIDRALRMVRGRSGERRRRRSPPSAAVRRSQEDVSMMSCTAPVRMCRLEAGRIIFLHMAAQGDFGCYFGGGRFIRPRRWPSKDWANAQELQKGSMIT